MVAALVEVDQHTLTPAVHGRQETVRWLERYAGNRSSNFQDV